jgi:hypothetical protein
MKAVEAHGLNLHGHQRIRRKNLIKYPVTNNKYFAKNLTANYLRRTLLYGFIKHERKIEIDRLKE